MDPMEVVSKFEGFELEKAEGIAHMFGWIINALENESSPMTADYNSKRINAVVKDGVIIKVLDVG